MASRFLILTISAMLFLAGCAWGPRIETSPVALPAGAATYRLIGVETPTAVDAAVEAALRRQLQAQGWREAGADAAWRVEAAYSMRPLKVGSYSDETARQEAWVAEPVLPQWWGRKRAVHSLTVTLTGPGDSSAAYRARAAVAGRERMSETTTDALTEAAVRALKPAA